MTIEEGQLIAEGQAWKLAALKCGLYRSDTDVSTPEKWQEAQAKAACELMDKAKETAKDFELAFRLVRKENDSLKAQITNLVKAAVEAYQQMRIMGMAPQAATLKAALYKPTDK